MAKSPASKQSPVTGKTPAKGPARGPAKGLSGRPAGLFTWLAIGLVVVVVATLVVIKVASGSGPSGKASDFQATDATTVTELTKIPLSIFNTIAVHSTVAQVAAPQPITGPPVLTSTSSTGAKLPWVFYLGAEYCPFCAAQRWPTIIALSRFGTWSGLGNTASSTLTGEVYPGTPTFTFLKATYKSKYLVFKGVEELNSVFNTAINNYSPLQRPTSQEAAILKKFDNSKWVKTLTASQSGSIPFITYGNRFLVAGASYTPATLQGLTRSAIAAGLSDPSSPVTDAIIASANYQSAALCTLTKNQPGSVCLSSGVMAAKRVMGIK